MITEKTTLSEVLKNPQSKEILAKHKVPCLGCPFAQMEMDELKIGDICKMYNIDVKSLTKDLNKVKS